ncbi:TrkH family potassium uptake protein [Mechercharimyces sp. CAU 1602]|uniref:TrkH family potassium uptake protein n=1 Tax=Mechercharimyces sp. CAU 1602 TaxID=2973933 RepID=UPI0021613A7C|nr:TrkH family potassium uptake protein [Mechercharimyces sp. CAU 1602]MCS1350232.1 TrkH family potassium uptake protein [Mechercharimyces sp. CAU 1602]
MHKKLLQYLSPPQFLVFGFTVLILFGTALLSLPIATETRDPLSLINALFTATSAVSVTGLVVVDTATTFSTFGECVILILIQLGGLGFMTISIFFAILLGKTIGVRERLTLRLSYHQTHIRGMVRLTLSVLIITAIVESVGFLLLAVRWVPEWGWTTGLYYSLFHSISSFNNAGFDLFGDIAEFSGLTTYVGDPWINMTIAALFLIGGIGFVVIADLYHYRTTKRLNLHTKLVLSVTSFLLIIGTFSLLLIEWSNPYTIGPLSLADKITASFFQGAAPRTAGFSTLNIADMYPASQLMLIMLMFIGAAPNSTGGGIKVTTFIIVVLAVWNMIRGNDENVSFKRRIPYKQVYLALSIWILTLSLTVVVTMLLTITEHTHLTTSFFETVSAVSTVGLTLGLTPELSAAGKLLITLTMLAGRLGPLTLAFAILQRQQKSVIRHPEESPLIG